MADPGYQCYEKKELKTKVKTIMKMSNPRNLKINTIVFDDKSLMGIEGTVDELGAFRSAME